MRDWSEDDHEPGGWLRAEITLVAVIQVAGIVALIGWLLL
jgi:hypothetical protein